jgi:hypothetical protein
MANTQGTRLDDTPPWMSYSSELDNKMSPELAAEVAEYAARHHENAPVSSQTQEELCRLAEGNADIAKDYQWLKPEDYADQEARIGRVMDHRQFITKLRDAGVQCFYRQHPHPDKAVLYSSQLGMTEPQIVCWVQIGQMPELSMMNFDSHGVPLAERRRGWRTCLLQAILKSVISEDKANKVFGDPPKRGPWKKYNDMLGEFRRSGSRLEN